MGKIETRYGIGERGRGASSKGGTGTGHEGGILAADESAGEKFLLRREKR